MHKYSIDDNTRSYARHTAFLIIARNNLLSIILASVNVVLPVGLFGCETWPLTLREEHRLKLFESRVLRRIFRPRRHKVRGWRRRLD
jgi:hypothetical protein